jgi:hypothetical protein
VRRDHDVIRIADLREERFHSFGVRLGQYCCADGFADSGRCLSQLRRVVRSDEYSAPRSANARAVAAPIPVLPATTKMLFDLNWFIFNLRLDFGFQFHEVRERVMTRQRRAPSRPHGSATAGVGTANAQTGLSTLRLSLESNVSEPLE